MVSDIFFICLCDKIFDNHFWNHFDFFIPSPQDDTLKLFTQKRSNKVNFKNLNELLAHVTKFECNHHKIIAKYLQCYVIFKNDRSVLIYQMADITFDEMKYILNTPYHNDKFKIHLKSMFKIIDVKEDENSGFNSITLGSNSIQNKKKSI